MLLKSIFFCIVKMHKKPAKKGQKRTAKLLKRDFLPLFFVQFDDDFTERRWRNFFRRITRWHLWKSLTIDFRAIPPFRGRYHNDKDRRSLVFFLGYFLTGFKSSGNRCPFCHERVLRHPLGVTCDKWQRRHKGTPAGQNGQNLTGTPCPKITMSKKEKDLRRGQFRTHCATDKAVISEFCYLNS